MKKSKYIVYCILLLFVGLPFAICAGLVVIFLSLIAIIEVEGVGNIYIAQEMRKDLDGGLYILGNHPWWIEVFIVPLLVTFPNFIFHPFKDFPWCTPKSTLLKFFPLMYCLRPLPVHRGKPSKMLGHLKEKAYILFVKKGIIMELPENGRTPSSKETAREYPNGKLLRPIKKGYFKTITDPNYYPYPQPEKVTVLPVWTTVHRGFKWTRLTVSFGDPCPGDKMLPERLEKVLIEL